MPKLKQRSFHHNRECQHLDASQSTATASSCSSKTLPPGVDPHPPLCHAVFRHKINLIKTFLELTSVTLVISDIDTAWTRNPIPFFNKYPEADILTSTGEAAAAAFAFQTNCSTHN